jgi:hypothetical protein
MPVAMTQFRREIDEFIEKLISANGFTATVKKHIKNETKNGLFKDTIGRLTSWIKGVAS